MGFVAEVVVVDVVAEFVVVVVVVHMLLEVVVVVAEFVVVVVVVVAAEVVAEVVVAVVAVVVVYMLLGHVQNVQLDTLPEAVREDVLLKYVTGDVDSIRQTDVTAICVNNATDSEPDMLPFNEPFAGSAHNVARTDETSKRNELTLRDKSMPSQPKFNNSRHKVVAMVVMVATLAEMVTISLMTTMSSLMTYQVLIRRKTFRRLLEGTTHWKIPVGVLKLSASMELRYQSPRIIWAVLQCVSNT